MHNLFYLRIVFLLFTFFLYSAEESEETKDAMIQRLRESIIPARFAALSVCIEEEQKQQGIKVDYELISKLDEKWTQVKKVKRNEYRKRKGQALLAVKGVGLHEVSCLLCKKIEDCCEVSACLKKRIDENDGTTEQAVLQKALKDEQAWEAVLQKALTADQQWVAQESERKKKKNDTYYSHKRKRVGAQPKDSEEIESELASTSDLAQRDEKETKEAMVQRIRESTIPARFAALSVCIEEEQKQQGIKVDYELISELDEKWTQAKKVKNNEYRRRKGRALLAVKAVGIHEVSCLLCAKIADCCEVSACLKKRIDENDGTTEQAELQKALQAEQAWEAVLQKALKADQQWVAKESKRKKNNYSNLRKKVGAQPEDSEEIESELASTSDLAQRDEEETREAMVQRLQKSKIPDRFEALKVLIAMPKKKGIKVDYALISEIDKKWEQAKQAKAAKNRRERYPESEVIALKVKAVGVHEISDLLKKRMKKKNRSKDKAVLQAALRADQRWIARHCKRRGVVAKKSRQKQAQKKRDEVVLKMQQSSADLGVDMAVGMEVEVDTDADTLFSLSGSEDDVLSAQQSSADLEVDMAVGMEVEVDADTLFSLSGSEDDVLSAQQSSADLGAEKVADILLAMLHDGFGGSKAHTTGPHPPSRKRSVYVGSKKSKSAKRKKVADLFTNESDGTR